METIVGTVGDDTFQGIVGHLDRFDDLDGGAGNDVLNLFIEGDEASDPISSLADVRDIETINFIYTDSTETGATINAAGFDGATQIWQIDDISGEDAGANDVTGVDSGVTVGFDGVEVTSTTVTAADLVTDLAVALKGANADGSTLGLTLAGDDLDTVSISGSVDKTVTGLELTFNGDTKNGVTTVNLDLTSDVTILPTASWNTVETVDASGSTGDITATVSGGDAFASITGGSGNDDFTVGAGTFSSKTLTIDGGAGNDAITLTRLETDTAITVTLGAGADRLDITGISEGNVGKADTDAELEASLLTITDFTTGQDELAGLTLADFDTQAGPTGVIATVEDVIGADGTLIDIVEALRAESNIQTGQFTYENEVYIYSADQGENPTEEVLIKLAGVDDLLVASDFATLVS